MHPRQHPPTIHEENIDAPLHQMHHHNVMNPAFTMMPVTQQAVVSNQAYHHSPNHAYQQQGVTVTVPAAVGQQHATPYRHQDDEVRPHHDPSPHTFSPTDGLHPQLRSWYSQDSSYAQESLRQLQLDATAACAGGDQGPKRVLVPSESLPPNFEGMKQQSEDSDELEEGNMTREIRERAVEIIEETSSNITIKTDIQKPFDPNLVCPTCGKQFCIFEIQIFKRHANECRMK